jgi:hypothetical protein
MPLIITLQPNALAAALLAAGWDPTAPLLPEFDPRSGLGLGSLGATPAGMCETAAYGLQPCALVAAGSSNPIAAAVAPVAVRPQAVVAPVISTPLAAARTTPPTPGTPSPVSSGGNDSLTSAAASAQAAAAAAKPAAVVVPPQPGVTPTVTPTPATPTNGIAACTPVAGSSTMCETAAYGLQPCSTLSACGEHFQYAIGTGVENPDITNVNPVTGVVESYNGPGGTPIPVTTTPLGPIGTPVINPTTGALISSTPNPAYVGQPTNSLLPAVTPPPASSSSSSSGSGSGSTPSNPISSAVTPPSSSYPVIIPPGSSLPGVSPASSSSSSSSSTSAPGTSFVNPTDSTNPLNSAITAYPTDSTTSPTDGSLYGTTEANWYSGSTSSTPSTSLTTSDTSVFGGALGLTDTEWYLILGGGAALLYFMSKK